MGETVPAEPSVTLTPSAAERVQALMKMEGKDNLMLRLAVSGGGCSGFQYGISLDDSVSEDDRVFRQHGVAVVIDQTSLELLGGSEVDFVEDLVGSSFQIRNPQATATCGCGSSFAM
jgi:iron-sulfur cluster insertion protein